MNQIDVTIMGQAYKLACKDGEQLALQNAAAFLDAKMCAIRDAAKIKGTDRIAVMAALAISADLLATKVPGGLFPEHTIADIKREIQNMNDVLDNALSPQEPLF